MRIADKSKANSVFIKRSLFDKSYSFGIYIFFATNINIVWMHVEYSVASNKS